MSAVLIGSLAPPPPPAPPVAPPVAPPGVGGAVPVDPPLSLLPQAARLTATPAAPAPARRARRVVVALSSLGSPMLSPFRRNVPMSGHTTVCPPWFTGALRRRVSQETL